MMGAVHAMELNPFLFTHRTQDGMRWERLEIPIEALEDVAETCGLPVGVEARFGYPQGICRRERNGDAKRLLGASEATRRAERRP